MGVGRWMRVWRDRWMCRCTYVWEGVGRRVDVGKWMDR